MKKNRILFILDSLGQGGAQRQASTVAGLLKQNGYDVIVLCYSPQNFFQPMLEEFGVPIIWMLEKRPLFRILKVRRYVRSGGFSAVISFLQTENIINLLTAVGGKKWRVICGERSSKENTFKTRKIKIVGYLLRYADYMVCNSENARLMWRRHYPQYESKYKVIYNSVHINATSSDYKPLKDEKLHVIIAASYQYLKNPVGMIEGINLLEKEDRQHLIVNWYGRREVVKGDTRAFDEARALINKYQLNDVIRLNEEHADILDLMKKADTVALFSKLEGLPNCICEAMTLGKPVIMTRVSDYEVLVDEGNGILCDWDNPLSIASAFTIMLNKNYQQLIVMGDNSRKKASSLFSENEVISKWEELIK